jgi:hypothetical protein
MLICLSIFSAPSVIGFKLFLPHADPARDDSTVGLYGWQPSDRSRKTQLLRYSSFEPYLVSRDYAVSPTATTHATGELYRDQNGGLWRCTTGVTPGTWLQILPALLAADPASGTFPTGYLLVNVTTGQLKIHAGGPVWKAVHLPVAGGTLDDGANVAVGAGTGTKIGTAVSQKLGFWGATPIVQPSGADQAAVTLGNVDGEMGGLTISDPPTQAEVQALRDQCEELADDLCSLSTLTCRPKPWRRVVHSLRTALVGEGLVRGSEWTDGSSSISIGRSSRGLVPVSIKILLPRPSRS